jgi:hypothetical protein
MEQLKSEEVVYSREEYLTTVSHHHHPQCVLAEVAHKRKGILAQEAVPQDELVIECKVRRGSGEREGGTERGERGEGEGGEFLSFDLLLSTDC